MNQSESIPPSPLPSPPRRLAIGPGSEAAGRWLMPGDELVIANESEEAVWVGVGRMPGFAPRPHPGDIRRYGDVRRIEELEAECSRLRAELDRARSERDAALVVGYNRTASIFAHYDSDAARAYYGAIRAAMAPDPRGITSKTAASIRRAAGLDAHDAHDAHDIHDASTSEGDRP